VIKQKALQSKHCKRFKGSWGREVICIGICIVMCSVAARFLVFSLSSRDSAFTREIFQYNLSRFRSYSKQDAKRKEKERENKRRLIGDSENIKEKNYP
jgi:hypothetical protein